MLSTKIMELVKSEFRTLAETSVEYGLSKVTLWRWIKAGKLPVHRIGREVLIEKSEIERLRR